MRFSCLNDWLLWQQGNHPREIDLGLDRVAQVADTLGLLHPQARVITVAGTNGKGSCVAALEALLSAAGLRCGAYTSPHILTYNERIRIDRKQIDDASLCAAFDAIDRARGDISLTYFEFGTLAALYLFQGQALDYWLLEVGLGGRLDATNIIDADIAVVTSIDLDHIEWLGDNRESIGREKAGIFRAHRPAICADPQPPASLIAHAESLGCSVSLIERDFGFREYAAAPDAAEQQPSFEFWSGEQESPRLNVNLPLPSLAAGYHVAQILGLSAVSELTKEFESLRLAGRMQCVGRMGHLFLLDVAHNPAATQQLAKNLGAGKWTARGRIAAVVAMMADKDLLLSLGPLCPWVSEWALTTIQDLPRAASADALMSALPDCRKQAYASVADALVSLVGRQEFDVILVTGSFYTVAEAQCWLDQG